MELTQYREKLFALALEQGCQGAETYYAGSDSFSVNASEGEIDRYDVSTAAGLSLRVELNGKNGYAYTESYDDPSELVRRAVDNARVIGTGDLCPMQGGREYSEPPACPDALSGLDEEQKIRFVIDMEQKAKSADERVQRCVYAMLEESRGHVAIHNTRGLKAERGFSMSMCYCGPVVTSGGETKSGGGFRVGREATDLEGCVREAVEDAVSRLGAKPVASGSYRVLISNLAFAELMDSFASVFSADEAQKGLSLLRDREGDAIASPLLTITDDPFHPISPRAFDDEGTPCAAKNIIENGVLKTLLHNLKTAQRAGCQSTGNALRASAASAVEVGPSNLVVQPGTTGFEELLARLDEGLLINELEGMHAGLDPISGDFSLKASGCQVHDGKRGEPVAQITVAGNFLSLLGQVECVGSDFRFSMPSRRLGFSGSPGVLVSSLRVAGK